MVFVNNMKCFPFFFFRPKPLVNPLAKTTKKTNFYKGYLYSLKTLSIKAQHHQKLFQGLFLSENEERKTFMFSTKIMG